MLSYCEIGEHLGLSKPRVCQLAKLGMPVHSLASAERWRQTNTVSRAPTNGKPKRIAPKKTRLHRQRKHANLQFTGDSLLDALNASIYVREAAFNLVQEAMNAGDIPAISPLISIHTHSLMLYFKAESAYRAELERRGVLVNKHEITEHCRKMLDAVLKRLKRLPHESGPQCNPGEPLMAFTILQRAVEDVIAVGRNVLQEL